METLLWCFSVALFFTAAFGSSVKNETGAKDPKIWSGTRAADGEVPWLASLHYFDYYGTGPLKCSGVIVSESFILTLASCIDEYFSSHPTYMSVYAGSLMSTGYGGSKHQALAYTKHESYDPNNRANDIALIEVFPPIPFNSRAYPIALPIQSATLRDDFAMTITGFGYDPTTTDHPDNYYGNPALKSQITTVNYNTCRNLHAGNQSYVTSDTICAGTPNRGCAYDEGGPLYHNGVLYGLIKRSGDIMCGPGTNGPGLHTRVSLFVDWIREHTGMYPSS